MSAIEMEPTMRVTVTEDDVDFILTGYANTAGMCEPDPRENPDHVEYLKSGYKGKELEKKIQQLCDMWDELYAFQKKWQRRKELFAKR